jgi:hypothetical protein
MPIPDGAAQVFSDVTRFSTLDSDGFPAVGSNVFVTDQMLKLTFTPAMETGVDLVTIKANGDIAQHYKHGDMPKYYTVQIEVANPDPVLHAILAGGTVFTDNTVALTAPTGTAAATGQITLGSLAAGTYGYRQSQFNQYGESAIGTEVTATVASGTAGLAVVGGLTPAAGALGLKVYGRSPGGEQLLGTIPNIGTQATSAASGTGTPTSLTVTALTSSVPSGTTFQIAGDTNTPKIVFTTTAPAGVGAVALEVSESQTITTTIAPGAIDPVFVDTGVLTPRGHYQASDTTAGPGNDTGYQSPPLGIVGNPDGVGIEVWGKAINGGTQVNYLPYWRWVIPGVRNLREDARTFDAALLPNMYQGEAFENPSFGSGPFGDWQFDSSRVFQYARAGRATLPVSGLAPIPATA